MKLAVNIEFMAAHARVPMRKYFWLQIMHIKLQKFCAIKCQWILYADPDAY